MAYIRCGGGDNFPSILDGNNNELVYCTIPSQGATALNSTQDSSKIYANDNLSCNITLQLSSSAGATRPVNGYFIVNDVIVRSLTTTSSSSDTFNYNFSKGDSIKVRVYNGYTQGPAGVSARFNSITK